MLKISRHIKIPEEEIKIKTILSQGPGGQNVNKTSTAIQLSFDIKASSLPETHKEKLLNLNDKRITKEGIFIIKSQQYRSRERNKEEALKRLSTIIRCISTPKKKRKPTKPTYGSREKRLQHKTKHSKQKGLRKKVESQ
jgi:ribosome-associated protein